MAVIEEQEPNPKATHHPSSSSGYTSDGYETASDTDLNDDVSSSDNNHHHKTHTNGGEAVKEEESQSSNKDAQEPNEEKALAEADDAKLEGNALFKDGLYEEALSKYEQAIELAPDGDSSTEIRSMCYANRAACFSKLGKYEETVKECTKALELNPTYLKALLRRAEAREKLEQYEESIADMTKVLELDQSNDQPRRAIVRLKPLADEKREKMKEEMIGKLKEMGNSILGRFGMSVDNFKAVKDPNTGSYSVSFQK